MSGPLDFGDEPRREPPRDDPDPSPSTPPAPPKRPAGSSRYGWFVGLAGFLLIVLVTINSVSTGGQEGGGGLQAGERLPPFAVPLADSSLAGDANIATKPGQDELGPRPACEVRGPEILNVCEEWELGPVVVAIFPTAAERCRRVLGQMTRLKGQFPRVRFAGVGAEGDRADLRGDWGFPVGWDRDRQVARAYGVIGCPQVTFANRGGEVVETVPRELTDAEFAEKVRRLR